MWDVMHYIAVMQTTPFVQFVQLLEGLRGKYAEMNIIIPILHLHFTIAAWM